MPRKSSIKSDILQEYGDAAATALRYGIEKDKLKKMRLLGIGPEYRTAGHRTVLYSWPLVEKWLASLPKGGGKDDCR